jgi:ABC-type lipoprotein export system ATPase subunit
VSVVETSAITKQYAGKVALAPTTLSLTAGHFLVVHGPTGAGKTTLVNLLAGWEAPDAGTIEWNGHARAPSWRDVTVIPQPLALLDELTVLENVLLPQRGEDGDGGRDASVASPLLEALGLDRLAERSPDEISVGERQRVMVARALCGSPSVVLADEPVAHQDTWHAEAVFAALRDAADHGAAVLVATREPGTVLTRVTDGDCVQHTRLEAVRP